MKCKGYDEERCCILRGVRFLTCSWAKVLKAAEPALTCGTHAKHKCSEAQIPLGGWCTLGSLGIANRSHTESHSALVNLRCSGSTEVKPQQLGGRSQAFPSRPGCQLGAQPKLCYVPLQGDMEARAQPVVPHSHAPWPPSGRKALSTSVEIQQGWWMQKAEGAKSK